MKALINKNSQRLFADKSGPLYGWLTSSGGGGHGLLCGSEGAPWSVDLSENS